MYFLLLFIFFALCVALVLTLFQSGRYALWSKLLRGFIVTSSIAFFSYWFFEKSINQFLENSLPVQVVNYLPQPVDFYIIKVTDQKDGTKFYESKRIGSVRSEYYRIEYLKMLDSNEFWVVGYVGKSRMIYFSQHSVVNKEEDKLIEVRNYINQSQKLSAIAAEKINDLKLYNVRLGVWVTLDLLLIFLNGVIFFRRKH